MSRPVPRPAGTLSLAPRSGKGLAVALLGALVATVVVAGCGKKGDPLPPIRQIPATATDLQAIRRGEHFLLSFQYPQTTAAGTPLSSVTEVTVWRLLWSTPEAAGDSPPQVDQRQFIAGARPDRMLSSDDLKAAVRGDRIALDLPVPTEEAKATAEPAGRPMVTLAVKTEGPTGEESGLSNLVTFAVQEPPAPPTGLEVEGEASGVRLRWELPETEEPRAADEATDDTATHAEDPLADEEADETEATDGHEDGPGLRGFNVYRRLSTEREYGAPVRTVGRKAHTVIDESALFGQRYIYTVTAVAERRPVLVESRFGEEVEINYRDRFAPPAPVGIIALVQEDPEGAAQVRLVWRPVEASDVAGYRVYRRSPASQEFQLITTETLADAALVDRDVTAGASYTYRVSAVDRGGNESEPSEQVTARVR